MAKTKKSEVVRSAKMMDKVSPGWAYKVKLKELDIACAFNCVLGQVYGSYTRGLDALYQQLGSCDGAFHDLYTDWDGATGAWTKNTTELWKVEIRKRRGKSGTRGRRQAVAA